MTAMLTDCALSGNLPRTPPRAEAPRLERARSASEASGGGAPASIGNASGDRRATALSPSERNARVSTPVGGAPGAVKEMGPRAQIRRSRWRQSSKHRDDGGVIARAHILLHRTRGRTRRERFGCEHVIEAPSDVALAQVAPRRPPREEPVVVWIERAADVDEPAAEDSLDHRALFGKLADRARLPFFRMHVALGARDVHVAHHRDRPSRSL